MSNEAEMPRQLQTMPGVGPITALAVETFAPPMDQFRRGRDFAAWLGLVPRQHSSGGKQKLGKTSKMGQRDIRRLLVIGATAVIRWAARRGAPKGSWLARMLDARWIVAFASDRNSYKDVPVDEFVAMPQEPMTWGDIATRLVDGPEPEPYRAEEWPAPSSSPVFPLKKKEEKKSSKPKDIKVPPSAQIDDEDIALVRSLVALRGGEVSALVDLP